MRPPRNAPGTMPDITPSPAEPSEAVQSAEPQTDPHIDSRRAANLPFAGRSGAGLPRFGGIPTPTEAIPSSRASQVVRPPESTRVSEQPRPLPPLHALSASGSGPPPMPGRAPAHAATIHGQPALPLPAPRIAEAPSSHSGVRADAGPARRPAATHVLRSRAYAFQLDATGKPIELGSGRSAKAFLGEERWIESKTDFRRDVVIKVLQKGVSEPDHMRFQMEKELLERVQGHPHIVHLYASGENEDPEFIPASIRDKVECEFVILERLEMSLEERLKGSRQRGKRDDLLSAEMHERIFRVLDYMIPVASAIEYAHIIRDVCHRDLKPANILIGLPNPALRGATLDVRIADFNVAKVENDEINFQMTRMNMQSIPGTLFFQSPEQETNVLELLVNVVHDSTEVEFFEDFYIQIEKNDSFALFNRGETYPILHADRGKKKLVLGRPYREVTETNVRAKVQKSVGRPADIYSIGAILYYLISGAYANPKTLYDNFHKFIEYERPDESNTVKEYLAHEYSVINSLRAPKSDDGVEVAPADRFFSYKHYLDGNGDLIDPHVMMIIARCMIRNKPDSYCQAHDIDTRGISDVVADMIDLYKLFGVHASARPANLASLGHSGARGGALARWASRLRWSLKRFFARFQRRR